MKFNTISLTCGRLDECVYRFIWSTAESRVAVITYYKGSVAVKHHAREYARTLYINAIKCGGKVRWNGVMSRDSEKMSLTDEMKKALSLVATG